jgi:signal transduction histidine kinase
MLCLETPAKETELAKLREENRWLREQLLLQNRLAGVGAIASSVAHEFNNVLMSLLNYSKLALKPTAKPEMKNTALEKVVQGCGKAAGLVNAMLGMTRNSGRKLQLTDLGELTAQVVSLCEKDLLKHRIRVEQSNSGPVPAWVMPALLEQVLLNLVINARQAMPQGGTLRLGVRANPEGNTGEIRIVDSGTGIDPEKLGHIFEPFFSTKDPDEEGRGGSGLGLSLCRQIIEAHNGRIRVESTPGKGTTFTIKIPLEMAQQVA